MDVCAAVIRRGSRLLLATRPPGSRMAGKWEFPGGKVSAGESLDVCIRREIAEELGLEVSAVVPLDVVEHGDPPGLIRLHFLACRIAPDAEPVCHEGQQAGWFTAAELAGLDLLPADRVFSERVLSAGLPDLV
jgi:8-oxo-dGTP diphosphatase